MRPRKRVTDEEIRRLVEAALAGAGG